MSTLEPIAGEIAKRDTGGDTQPAYPLPEPPALRKLWRGIKWIYVLNMAVAVGAFSQAYFAHRANQLTREALNRTLDQHIQLLEHGKALNAETLAASERMNTAMLQQNERLTTEGLRESRESTRAALEAVAAARESNKANQAFFESDQRPWLLVSEITLNELTPEANEDG